MGVRRRLARLAGAALVAVSLLATARPGRAQTATDLTEVSQSCVAVGQHFPTFTVWGTGFDQWIQAGGTLDVEWSWGGAPTTPDPAAVKPASQRAPGGSFTLTFDVTGLSQGNGVFEVVSTNASGSPTLVGQADVSIQPSCPVGAASCSTTPGPATLLVQTSGYDPSFPEDFVYQYHLKDQVGPVSGTAQPDNSVRGQFQPAPQSQNATVTARIVQPAVGDSSSRTYFITFPAPVCRAVPAPSTTSLAATTTTRLGVTTTTPGTVRSTTSTSPGTGPGTVLGRTPILAVSPAVGSGGSVVTITGSGFPSNVDVILSWSPGIGQATAHSDALGTFTTALLVFNRDITGPRQLVAAGFSGAFANFLDELGSVQPPGSAGGDFVFRR